MVLETAGPMVKHLNFAEFDVFPTVFCNFSLFCRSGGLVAFMKGRAQGLFSLSPLNPLCGRAGNGQVPL